MSVPNMKFLCLILWLREVCTDTIDADANDASRRTKHDCIELFIIMTNKTKSLEIFLCSYLRNCNEGYTYI